MKTDIIKIISAVCVFVFILINPVWALTYKAVILNSPGFWESRANGAGGGQQVGWGGGEATDWTIHAIIWNGKTEGFIDLNPSEFVESEAEATNGIQQVGCINPNETNKHAILWNGSAENYIDLNPEYFEESIALGINGNQQVGWGRSEELTMGYKHALLWEGTAQSVIDLNPYFDLITREGFDVTYALGICGTQQVGYGHSMTLHGPRALLWTGTAQSCVDITPADFNWAVVNGTNGIQQVGFGEALSGSDEHALLWSGTAQSVIDLTPQGFERAAAKGINATHQVGSGRSSTLTDGNDHALVWNGSADSYVDLHQFLPAQYAHWMSYASCIDSNGNIAGTIAIVIGDLDDPSGYQINYAVMWKPVICTSPIAGDLNGDCKVDFEDFSLMAHNWLQCNLDPPDACW